MFKNVSRIWLWPCTLFISLLTTIPAQAVPGDWPQFRFSPTQTGYNPVEDVLNPSNVSNLDLLWSYRGIGTSGFQSSPVVADGIVYAANGDGAGSVFETGNNLFAFKAADGALLWSQPCAGRNNGSAPAVADGVVYVTTGLPSRLCAFEAATGRPLWNQEFPLPDNYKIWASPTVAKGVVYVGTDSGALYAFRASDGTPLWNQHTGGQIICSPAVAGNAVYIGGGDTVSGQLNAFKAADGTPLWNHSMDAAVGQLSCPAVADDVLYVQSQYGQLFAFNAADGTPLWNHSLGTGPYTWPDFSSPAVAYGMIYVGSQSGKLYAFKAANGTLLWSKPTGGPITSAPVVASKVIYVGSTDGQLYAFNAADGTLLWSYSVVTPLYKSLAVAHGVIYVMFGDADGTGNLYTFTIP